LRVIESARAEVVEEGYDSWNGGQYYYTLYLDIPLELFVELESQFSKIESVLEEEVKSLRRGSSNQHITKVTIRSGPDSTPASIPLVEAAFRFPSPDFWKMGYLRLFLSHSSAHNARAHELKAALDTFHVCAFVAHDDIDPTDQWQLEIESALNTMDVLAVMLTPDVLQSKWCDQEAGIAIGLKRLVVPIRLGADPHGFLGKYQGLAAVGKEMLQIADELVTILVQHESTRVRMTSAVVDKFARSASFTGAMANMTLLERVPMLTPEMARQLQVALKDNGQVSRAFGVPGRLNRLLAKYGYTEAP